jgi:carbamoyltransferase
MQRAYLGQQSYDTDSRTYLDSINAPYEYLADDELFPRLAQILGDENVVGWFHGRMEFGLRALGGVLFLAIHVVRKCSR